MIFIESYNVKLVTFPDLTKQFRVYSKIISYNARHVTSKVETCDNPFDDRLGKVIKGDLDDYYDHIAETSLRRTKQRVYNLARSNNWDWFVTFTFSKEKVDRYDYSNVSKLLSKWLNNLRRSSPDLSYLVVPEQHKDGAWHFHGLFAGLSKKDIVWTGRYVIKKIPGKDGSRTRFFRTSQKIYKFGKYKFGWMTATKILHKDRVTKYITKYLTKDLVSGSFGRKRYWASRNLLEPVEEVFCLDPVDLDVMSMDLDSAADFKTVSQVYLDVVPLSLELYEVKSDNKRLSVESQGEEWLKQRKISVVSGMMTRLQGL